MTDWSPRRPYKLATRDRYVTARERPRLPSAAALAQYAERCPTCGAKVMTPCLLCEVRELKGSA